MKSLHHHHSSHSGNTATLQPGQPVHTLVIARGHRVELTSAAGCTWLTRDGVLEDWFLPAGGQLTVQGPASLRLGSAHLHAAAEVQWQTSRLPRYRRWRWLGQHLSANPVAPGLLSGVELGIGTGHQR